MISGAAITSGSVDLSDEELRRIDAEAYRLTRRRRQQERLRLGDALATLGDGFKELGFRNFTAYVKERVGLGVRWCGDARAMSRRSLDLPRIRRALLSDRVGWSLAELLSRHASADDEEELLEACRGETIRAVRRILKERGEQPEPEPDVEERFATLELTVPLEQAVGLEVARRQVEHVNGGPGEPGSWLECLLMESHTTLLALAPGAFEGAEDVAAELRGWIEARRAAEQRNVDAEERARPEPVDLAAMDDDEEAEECLPHDPVALDRVIRERAKRIASGDVWLGQLLDTLFRARAWERLGYATETQYALDRYGMSRSAARQLITLTRRARWLDGLSDAVQDGRIYPSHASAIARVATPDTLEAWIDRATRRTYKHLLEEVRLAELCMRFGGDDDDPVEPPTEEAIEEWHRIEADWLSGDFLKRWSTEVETVSAPVEMLEGADDEPYRQYGEHIDAIESALAAVQMSVASAAQPESAKEPVAVQMSVAPSAAHDSPDGARAVQMSVASTTEGDALHEPPAVQTSAAAAAAHRARRHLATASARIVVRENVRIFYRELEAIFRRSGLPGTFVELLLVDFWRSWAHLFEVGNKWKPIHDRDRHQCRCPVCVVKKSLSNHHITYRAHGGGDEPSNQIIACDFCHLDGEHGGRLRVRGTAEHATWLLGRTPILRVAGRDKIELNDRAAYQ